MLRDFSLFKPNLINMNVHSATCSCSVELYKLWYTLADFLPNWNFPGVFSIYYTYLNTCVMIPIGPSRAPRGMSRPVSSRSLSGIQSRLVCSLGRVASRMSPVACFEALSIHTVLNFTGQIVPFFTNTSTEKVFFAVQAWRPGS